MMTETSKTTGKHTPFIMSRILTRCNLFDCLVAANKGRSTSAIECRLTIAHADFFHCLLIIIPVLRAHHVQSYQELSVLLFHHSWSSFFAHHCWARLHWYAVFKTFSGFQFHVSRLFICKSCRSTGSWTASNKLKGGGVFHDLLYGYCNVTHKSVVSTGIYSTSIIV